VERRLPGLLPAENERPESVHRAMRYAALGAGKRVRPVLTLAVVEMFGGGDDEAVVDVACAVELVSTSPSSDWPTRRSGWSCRVTPPRTWFITSPTRSAPAG
jgi:hypothetical protein